MRRVVLSDVGRPGVVGGSARGRVGAHKAVTGAFAELVVCGRFPGRAEVVEVGEVPE